MRDLLTIGQLAKRSGAPVKTIRYYDEAGVLKPSAVSEAGYRLYTEGDAARLESIRALRELGFPLAAIRTMLDGEHAAHALIEVQLDVVKAQTRALRRQAAILQSALTHGDSSDAIRALHLAHAAASLGAAERASKIDRFMHRASTSAASKNSAKLRDMVLGGLPEDLTAEQLEAWLALSALLDDERLIATIHKQQAPFKNVKMDQEAFGARMREILADAMRFSNDSKTAQDPQVRRLAERWAKTFADALGKPMDAKFKRWFKTFATETNDPRIERFWQLVCVLHGRPPAPPFTPAQALLIEAL